MRLFENGFLITGGFGSLTISASKEPIGSSLFSFREKQGKKKFRSRQLPVIPETSKKNVNGFHERTGFNCGAVI
jgi:hypothetical protein